LGKDEDTGAVISGGLSLSLLNNDTFTYSILVKKINQALRETQLL